MFDGGAKHFQLHAEVCFGRVDTHHRQRDIEEHVDDFHELQKRLGILAAEPADLGGGFLAIAPEDQRLAIRMQVHIPRRKLYRFETVSIKSQLRWHMGMHAHRHHVQGTGMNQMLRRFGYQVTRGGHPADLVQCLQNQHLLAFQAQVAASRKAIGATADDDHIEVGISRFVVLIHHLLP
ncbi:hypothetical protein D3C86_1683480 [compost metagenome]